MRITGTEAYFFIPLNFENSERKKEKEKKESSDNSEGRVKGENKNKKTDIFYMGQLDFLDSLLNTNHQVISVVYPLCSPSTEFKMREVCFHILETIEINDAKL